jgi:hypothetical protein
MSSTSKENGVRRGKFGFNSEIRHHIRIRDRLHRKLKSSPTVHNRNIYKIRRNKVNNMISNMMPNFRIKPWFICSTNIDYFGWNTFLCHFY